MKTKKLLIVSMLTAGLIFFSGLSQNLFSQSLESFDNSIQPIDGNKPQLSMYNTPDPFTQSTTIICNIPFPGVYTLTIYERSTGKVLQLFEGPMGVGKLLLIFSPDGNTPEVYDAELKTFQSSVKDVMIKEAKLGSIDDF